MAQILACLALVGSVTAFGAVAPLRAQSAFCKTALEARPALDADSDVGSPAYMRAYPALETLDSAIVTPIASAIASARDPLSRFRPLGTSAAAYAFIFTSDTAYARATAVYLTRLIAGSSRGVSIDKAWAASKVYAAWHLPPAPALTLLRANWASATSRLYALTALGDHVRDSSFYLAGVAALCSLAARSAAL